MQYCQSNEYNVVYLKHEYVNITLRHLTAIIIAFIVGGARVYGMKLHCDCLREIKSKGGRLLVTKLGGRWIDMEGSAARGLERAVQDQFVSSFFPLSYCYSVLSFVSLVSCCHEKRFCKKPRPLKIT